MTEKELLSCAEADAHYKRIANEYRYSAKLLKCRIDKVKREIKCSEHGSSLEAELEHRLSILNQMYRSTTEIGREAKHYYDKWWWRSEIYTFNRR